MRVCHGTDLVNPRSRKGVDLDRKKSSPHSPAWMNGGPSETDSDDVDITMVVVVVVVENNSCFPSTIRAPV